MTPPSQTRDLSRALFVSATGTGVGKTYVCRALAAALHELGLHVAALKPIETGITDSANPSQPIASQLIPELRTDAELLARACRRPELANAPGFYRAAPPLSPYAAALATCTPPPRVEDLAVAIRAHAAGADALIVEGAGGLLVPLNREHAIADLVAALDMPLLLIASDALGVLSHVLTAAESAARRNLKLAGVVLTQHTLGSQAPDESRAHNRVILSERLACPVLAFPACENDDAILATAARASGLLALFQSL